jgi:hypothetical protein
MNDPRYHISKQPQVRPRLSIDQVEKVERIKKKMHMPSLQSVVDLALAELYQDQFPDEKGVLKPCMTTNSA